MIPVTRESMVRWRGRPTVELDSRRMYGELPGISSEAISPISSFKLDSLKSEDSEHTDGLGESDSKPKKKSKRLEVSRVVGPDTYIMGIIDFQQKWNLNKKVKASIGTTYDLLFIIYYIPKI